MKKLKGNDVAENDVIRGERGRWVKGTPSPSPGRPVGSRHKWTDAFLKDLAKVWADEGEAAMRQTAREEPAKFVAICASLIPKDVQVAISARLPGNLNPDDWELAMSVFSAVREALPDANQRAPSNVLQHVLDALRAYDAKLVESSTDVANSLPKATKRAQNGNESQ
jgi:hypothetical protein